MKITFLVLATTTLVLFVGAFVLPHVANADHCAKGLIHTKVQIPGLPDGQKTDECLPPTPETTETGPVEQAVLSLLSLAALAVLNLGALFVGITGKALDLAVDVTVIQAGSLLGDIGAISLAWSILRDVANMLFIFILLYISIMTILRASSFGTGKLLANVVVAALLINFSLFFSSVIIDTSNILTVEFYKPIAAAVGTRNVSIAQTGGEDFQSTGIAAAFMGSLNLAGVYGDPAGAGDTNGVVRMLGASVFMFVAAFVFVTAAILLVIRFIIFVILMVTSPFAFIGNLLPGVGDLSKKWWKTMMDQALFGPVYMLLTSIAFIVVTDETFVEQVSSEGTIGTSLSGGSVATIISFMIVIGMLLAAIIIAKSLSSQGASFATRWAGKAVYGTSGRIGGAFFGGAGALGRNTVGRLGQAATQSERLNQLAASNNVFKRTLGAGLLRSGDLAQQSSFDLRKGATFGKASKKNFKKSEEGRSKRFEGYIEKGGRASDETRDNFADARAALSEKANRVSNDEAAKATRLNKARANANAAKQSGVETVAAAEKARDKAHATGNSELMSAADARLAKAELALEQLSVSAQQASDEFDKLAPEQREYADASTTYDVASKALADERTAVSKQLAEQHLTASGTPDASSRRAAAAKWRKGKSDKDKVFEAAKKALESQDSGGTPPNPPAPPSAAA